MAPKIVINVESPNDVELSISVKASDADGDLGVKGKSGEKEKGPGKFQSFPTKGYASSSAAGKGGASSSQAESSAASASTNLESIPTNPKAESMVEGDWEKVTYDEQIESPVPPSHSPPSPVPPADSPPRPAAIAGPPMSESESSSTPGLLERDFVATRKSGRAFHLSTCGMMRNKLRADLHIGLRCCPICTGPRQLQNDWKFAISHSDPRKMHLMAPDGSTHCRMQSIDAIWMPCRQCIHG